MIRVQSLPYHAGNQSQVARCITAAVILSGSDENEMICRLYSSKTFETFLYRRDDSRPIILTDEELTGCFCTELGIPFDGTMPFEPDLRSKIWITEEYRMGFGQTGGDTGHLFAKYDILELYDRGRDYYKMEGGFTEDAFVLIHEEEPDDPNAFWHEYVNFEILKEAHKNVLESDLRAEILRMSGNSEIFLYPVPRRPEF